MVSRVPEHGEVSNPELIPGGLGTARVHTHETALLANASFPVWAGTAVCPLISILLFSYSYRPLDFWHFSSQPCR